MNTLPRFLLVALSGAPFATLAQSSTEHVPPDPPQHEVHDMSYRDMTAMMQMDDRAAFGRVLLDQAEWRDDPHNSVFAWDAMAQYGGDYNKVLLRTDGERVSDEFDNARVELLWDRVFARWWSLQLGARRDFGDGPDRTWVAAGISGLAPYWFKLESTVYAGSEGRTALNLKAEYELLLTQRWILQPEVELNAYSKSDPERNIGSGLSDVEAGLRLRFEIRRELAPYVGIAWTRRFGTTADLSKASGDEAVDTTFVAGLRVWF